MVDVIEVKCHCDARNSLAVLGNQQSNGWGLTGELKDASSAATLCLYYWLRPRLMVRMDTTIKSESVCVRKSV